MSNSIVNETCLSELKFQTCCPILHYIATHFCKGADYEMERSKQLSFIVTMAFSYRKLKLFNVLNNTSVLNIYFHHYIFPQKFFFLFSSLSLQMLIRWKLRVCSYQPKRLFLVSITLVEETQSSYHLH